MASDDADFWPKKQMFGLDEMQQTTANGQSYDQMMENLDVYGETLFLQAKEIQGADSFCDNDASLMFHPALDIPFEQIPVSRKMFKLRDHQNYKAHPNMQDIIESYEEGRQNGLVADMVFNIPVTYVDSKDYFGNQVQQGTLCGFNYTDSLKMAAEIAAGENQQQNEMNSYFQTRSGTKTPSKKMPPKKKALIKAGAKLSQDPRTDSDCKELLKTASDVHDKILHLKAEEKILHTQYDELMEEIQREMIVRDKEVFECGERGSFVLKIHPKKLHGMNQKYLTECLAKKGLENPEDVTNEFYASIPTEDVYSVERKIPKNSTVAAEKAKPSTEKKRKAPEEGADEE